MRLDQALTEKGYARSRTEAKAYVLARLVLVNGSVCTKPAKEVGSGDLFVVLKKKPFVGRAGEKLEGILRGLFVTEEGISSFLAGKRALDVGSSTGGFTECLITHGIQYVDAVDVGTNQLHESLRNNPKITVYEGTDIRSFPKNKTYDVVVADVSFISLSYILPDLFTFGTKGTHYFILIKPQFEVGKGNTVHGIVTNDLLIREVLLKYEKAFIEAGCKDVRITPSVVQGKEGNQEFFITGHL